MDFSEYTSKANVLADKIQKKIEEISSFLKQHPNETYTYKVDGEERVSTGFLSRIQNFFHAQANRKDQKDLDQGIKEMNHDIEVYTRDSKYMQSVLKTDKNLRETDKIFFKKYLDLYDLIIDFQKTRISFFESCKQPIKELKQIVKEFKVPETSSSNNAKAAYITAVATAIVSLSSIGLRTYNSLKVKALIELTMNSKNYKEMAKYINALKSMKNNSWFTTSASAKELANTTVDKIKKVYIGTGMTLIIISCIAVIAFGFSSDISSKFKELAKELNLNSLINFLKDAVALGFLMIPGVIGVGLMAIAFRGFQEEGLIENVMNKLSPVITLTNKIANHFIEELS